MFCRSVGQTVPFRLRCVQPLVAPTSALLSLQRVPTLLPTAAGFYLYFFISLSVAVNSPLSLYMVVKSSGARMNMPVCSATWTFLKASAKPLSLEVSLQNSDAWESLSCSPVWGSKWVLLFLWIIIYIFSAFLAWVLPEPVKSRFLFFEGNIPRPKGVGFAQLAAMSQCTETDPGGLAAWLSHSTQPELCPILGFPLKVILPQRVASLSTEGF